MQKMWFEPQVKLACDLKLPLFLHERNASKDFLKILDTYKDRPRVLVHCFTGTKDELDEYLSWILRLVLGWICKSKRGQDLRNAISETSKNFADRQ